MTEGIYILGNDVVHDQLVALLNSIELNEGSGYPICVIPYDDRIEKVKKEVQTRNNVSLLEDTSVIARWEDFATQVWKARLKALESSQQQGVNGLSRMGLHRRFSAFDGPFEKFIYLDADILVMNSLKPIFQPLEQHDWVVYDFKYKNPSHIYNKQSPKLLEVFPQARIDSETFISGMYASKRGIFDEGRRNWLLSQLQAGEAEILYPGTFDQPILNYMVMRSGISSYNLGQHLTASRRTGCCVTSDHFEEHDHILYDNGERLTYLHYIGLSSQLFSRVCAGENIDFPYRDIFLHYRYLHEPEKRPIFTTKPKSYKPQPSLMDRILKKIKLTK